MEAIDWTVEEIRSRKGYFKIVKTINTSYKPEHFMAVHNMIDNYTRLYGTSSYNIVSRNIILDRSFLLLEMLNIRREVLED